MERRKKHGIQTDIAIKEAAERGQKGNRNKNWMDIKSCWGSFRTSLIGKEHMDSKSTQWKYKSTSNSNLTAVHLGKVWTGQRRVLLMGLPIKALISSESGG